MHLDSRHTMLCGGGEASHRSNDMTEFSLVYLRVLNSSGSEVYWDCRVVFKFGELLTSLVPITVSYPFKHKIGLVELIHLASTDQWCDIDMEIALESLR